MPNYKGGVATQRPLSSSVPSNPTMRMSWFSRRRQDRTSLTQSSISLPISAGPTFETFSTHSIPSGSSLDMPSFEEPRPRRRVRPQSTFDPAFEHIYEDSVVYRPHSVYFPSTSAAMSSPALGIFDNHWQTALPIPQPQTPVESAPARRSRRSGSPPEVKKRSSSLLSLSMLQTDVSMDSTPPLSSASSASGDAQDETWQEPSSKRRSGFWRSSRVDLTIDMAKVRDGMGKRQSSSGVYTPTTFPGASGPHPHCYPSSVYTPPGFNLSTTPIPPRSRFDSQSKAATRLASKLSSAVNRAQGAFAGWKRSPPTPQAEIPSMPQTPSSNHDSYFVFTPTTTDSGHVIYSAGHYAETSPALSSPRSINASAQVAKPAVTGLGFPEYESLAKTSKGVRRKAVPKLIRDEADLRAQLERIAHAQVA